MDSYFTPRQPGSFGSASIFRKHLNEKFTTKQIKDWLLTRDCYTLHKPARFHFRRRKIFSGYIDDLWQADLADVSSLSNQNDGCRYLLTCIDVLSKYAWAIPLKNKRALTVANAFSKIITYRKPVHLQTDKGSEFLNATFQKLLKDNGIKFYTTENDDIKAAVVERFNRTLKTKMWKYFTYKNTLRYTDVLDDLLRSYNDTFHSSIKMAPSEVNPQNESEVCRRLFPPKKPTKYKLNIDDKVRISKARREFKKGYLPNWSDEIFKVIARYPSDPPTYEIVDYDGEKLKGKFYDFELQKIVKRDDVYKIEKILKTRKKGKKKEYFVKWTGYPDKFNSWVSDIKKI